LDELAAASIDGNPRLEAVEDWLELEPLAALAMP
jgi:hypothetical protein